MSRVTTHVLSDQSNRNLLNYPKACVVASGLRHQNDDQSYILSASLWSNVRQDHVFKNVVRVSFGCRVVFINANKHCDVIMSGMRLKTYMFIFDFICWHFELFV